LLLKSVENELKKESAASTKLTKKRDEASAKVGRLKAQIDQLDFSEDDYALLEREKQELESSVSDLRQITETLTAKLNAKLSFRYQDPVRGFDRSKVKGLVSKLIAVRDPKNATALEVAAAGKLYQVVVDEAITGKALLDRGKLERRVTLIPLDKIKPRQLGKKTCEDASAIAAQSNAAAQPAIELVEFDEEVRSAIEYVFGATFVVDAGKAASQICDATKMRTVTLEGDMYDPSGTISGGSKDSLGSTLSNLYDLKMATQDLNEKQARLAIVSEKLRSMEATSRKFEKVSRDLEIAQAELKAADSHLSQTTFGVMVEKRDAMTSDLDAAQRECIEMEKEKNEKRDLYESLKAREKDLTQEREKRLKQLEKTVQTAKVEATEKTKRAGEVCQSAFDGTFLALYSFSYSFPLGRVEVANVQFGVGVSRI
jgi:structural maintenance of chromosome 2